MAAPGTCTSPSKTAGNRSCVSSFTAAQHQHHVLQARRHQVILSAAPAARLVPCSSPSSSIARVRFPAAAATLQPPGLHCCNNAGALQRLIAPQLPANNSRRCVCRSNTPAGGPVGPVSSGGSEESEQQEAEAAAAAAGGSGLSRAVSPVGTAQQQPQGSLGALDSSSSSSTGSMPPGINLEQQLLGDVAGSPAGHSAAAAAAAVPLPGLPGSSSIPAAVTATAAAAAAAEAAVAGALEAQTGHALGVAGVTQAEPAAAGSLQDLFSLLKFQVSAALPPAQLMSTLLPVVRCAAASQLTLSFVSSSGRAPLLLQLMAAEETAVAVLAAEAWCRVCGDEDDLEAHTDTLLPAVPVLLSLIGSNASPEGRKVPLLFFAVSSLVRMATLPAVAAAVQQQGGLQMLVDALHVVPSAICQVTTFALFRLMREINGDLTDEQLASWPTQQQQQQQQVGAAGSNGSSSSSGQELVLVTYARAGAFSRLCQVLAQVEEGSAHELAFSMLLSLSLIPEAQQLVADRGEVKQLVQVMSAPPSRAVRLEALLVLGRLAARNRACQQDAVREGAVPPLVELMMDGSDEERCHACRLLAILGQHETTHQTIMDWGAVPVMLQLLRDRGANVTFAPAQHDTAQQHADAEGLAAHTLINNTSMQSGLETEARHNSSSGSNGNSSSSGVSDGDGIHSREPTSGPFRAPKRPSRHAGAAAAAGADKGVGPELVLEQAAGLACMLCHNPDNHFTLVNQGIVPMLVSLLQGSAPKTVTYTLASLLMLCMGDARNAAVVARAGANPALVSIARENSNRPANRELAAALLAVMCRSQAAQVDVVASGGIPALTRLLAEGTTGACCSAAEALTQIATTSDVRCRLIVRAGALPLLAPMMQPNSSPASLLWATRLLKALAQERNTLWEVCETPGLLALLPAILNRTASDDGMQQLILEFRCALNKSSSSAAAAAAGVGEERDEIEEHDLHSSSNGSILQAGTAAKETGLEAATGSSRQHRQDIQAAAGSSHQHLQAGASEGVVTAASDEETAQKAQAHVAWLLAALASDPRTRDVMAELASFLVRPLVEMLRASQESAGPGYTLQDVLHGMANNRQAAASAALRALSRHVRIAGLIRSEITLQSWMGYRVQLPEAAGEWPPATPGWFLNVDMWAPEGPGEDH